MRLAISLPSTAEGTSAATEDRVAGVMRRLRADVGAMACPVAPLTASELRALAQALRDLASDLCERAGRVE